MVSVLNYVSCKVADVIGWMEKPTEGEGDHGVTDTATVGVDSTMSKEGTSSASIFVFVMVAEHASVCDEGSNETNQVEKVSKNGDRA